MSNKRITVISFREEQMARMPRLNVLGIPQHIIQRGNNRQPCFGSEQDFAAYAHWLKEGAEKYQVAIHAWVFMTNHVHLLVTPKTETGVSQLMQYLGRYYVQYFNREYRRSGTLWEGRYKFCLLQEESYLLQCYRSIELNPVRANIVNHPAEYIWSSYAINAQGITSSLHTPHTLYLNLGKTAEERQTAYQSLFTSHIDKETEASIRKATNTGMVLGNDHLKDQIEALTERRVRPKKAGRQAKEKATRRKRL